MIYHHSPIYDFSDYDTTDLKRALQLYSELDDLNLGFFETEFVAEIMSELKKREKKDARLVKKILGKYNRDGARKTGTKC